MIEFPEWSLSINVNYSDGVTVSPSSQWPKCTECVIEERSVGRCVLADHESEGFKSVESSRIARGDIP